VIDQRGGGGAGALPVGRIGGGLGITGALIFLAIQLLAGGSGAFDVNPGFDGGVQAPGQPTGIPNAQDPDKDLKDFSAYVFTDTQRTWEQTFRHDGKSYDHAKLVLYRSGVQTGCGSASSSVGPFYCPADQRVYLDLSFYDDMKRQLGASGDFAWAYVIAHEMGHHVQKQLGTSDDVRARQESHPEDANALSVRTELQADCYAGVWANTVYTKGNLDPGDIDEAFTASEAVGDDRLQKRATGSVDPDSFTHGTSAQRKHWFQRGYEAGDAGNCDTFAAERL
jgi:uncharacterized protein